MSRRSPSEMSIEFLRVPHCPQPKGIKVPYCPYTYPVQPLPPPPSRYPPLLAPNPPLLAPTPPLPPPAPPLPASPGTPHSLCPGTLNAFPNQTQPWQQQQLRTNALGWSPSSPATTTTTPPPPEHHHHHHHHPQHHHETRVYILPSSKGSSTV